MNNLTTKFYKKFFQYLLIGSSAMVLLLAGQQGLFVKPQVSDFTLAQSEEGTIPNDATLAEVGSGTIDQPTTAGQAALTQAAPARNDACNPVGSAWTDCSDATGNTGHKYCEWQPNGNVKSDFCSIEACVYGGTAPNCNPAPVQPEPAPAAPVEPAPAPQPARVDQCSDTDTPDTQTCGNNVGTGHKYCTWTPSGNVWSDCKIESCNKGELAPPACTQDYASPGNANSQWECERAVAQGRNICDDNVIYCENSTDGSRNSMMVTKHSGVCNPNSGMRDSRGCIFQYQKDEQKPLFCSEREQAPARGEAPAQAAAPQQVQCVVCDQGRYRLSVMCTNAPICNINNPNQGACVGAAVGQECPPRPAPAVPPPAAGGATATGGAGGAGGAGGVGGAGGSSTVTITQPAQPVAQVVLTRTVSAADGNVGVGTTVISGQVLGVKELPKTGLPALVWSALAFIPTGFGLRRFSKVKKDLQNHPSFIFEERQFKSES